METSTQQRRDRMAVLARAKTASLVEHWKSLGLDPEFTMVRAPQTGIVGLRGRIGGGGDTFNFGEATITRATVKLGNGAVGHSYALGRDEAKAKLAAVIDALCLDAGQAQTIDNKLVAPLKTELEARDKRRADETAATKVDFFTMVRGDD